MATKKKSDGKRSVKVGEAMRAELMTMLLAGDIHDPGVTQAVVSSVSVTDDLRLAKVYVRRLAPESTDAEKKALIDALHRARGFMRRELAQRLELRHAPDLRFYWDEALDRGIEMEMLLREIKREDDGK
jgi:ribosome-binding factor A